MSLEQTVVTVLASDLGPAASSFLQRQCQQHLHKEAGALDKADMQELSKWVFVGVKLTLSEAIDGVS